MKKMHKITAATALGFCVINAFAAGAADIVRLGKDLTAVGGEKAGNKEGSIPAFAGGEKTPAGWVPGKVREDFWKYKSEKPLFVIDASNVDKYADKLTPGQIEMIKTIKGYTMPIYPSRRECGFPSFVEQHTKDNAAKSAIGKDGWSLASAMLPGVPFPIPSNGIEAVWNHLMRYVGLGWEIESIQHVSPKPGSETPIRLRAYSLYYRPWAAKDGYALKNGEGLQEGAYYVYKEPAALAGQGTVQRFYFDKTSDSYYYFTGQRRVRRLPTYAYDAPLIGYENQYMVDQTWILYGNPDRFDWKLKGKKEIYIPYNNFAMQRFNTSVNDVTGERFLNPSIRRYELHRVWEVEGTVKAGARHATPKKTLYLDEDTWLAAVGDDYDAKGKVWKAKENFIAPQWELGACAINGFVMTDMVSERYLLDVSPLGTGKDIQFFPPGSSDKRLTDSYFTDENLGAISAR